MLFMLFHLDDPCSGLREALRVLAPRGRVATLTWAGEMESPASRIWARSLDAHGAAPLDPSSTARHELVDSPEKMAALLREAGFREPDCGVEPLVSALDADHLVRLRTRMGANKPRFDSLEPAARTACMASARRRMAGLTPEAAIVVATVRALKMHGGVKKESLAAPDPAAVQRGGVERSGGEIDAHVELDLSEARRKVRSWERAHVPSVSSN